VEIGGGYTEFAGAEMLRCGGHTSGSQGCVEAKQVAVVGHPSDEENPKTSKFALKGLVSLVIK
jgi:hypothetical protein